MNYTRKRELEKFQTLRPTRELYREDEIWKKSRFELPTYFLKHKTQNSPWTMTLQRESSSKESSLQAKNFRTRSPTTEKEISSSSATSTILCLHPEQSWIQRNKSRSITQNFSHNLFYSNSTIFISPEKFSMLSFFKIFCLVYRFLRAKNKKYSNLQFIFFWKAHKTFRMIFSWPILLKNWWDNRLSTDSVFVFFFDSNSQTLWWIKEFPYTLDKKYDENLQQKNK